MACVCCDRFFFGGRSRRDFFLLRASSSYPRQPIAVSSPYHRMITRPPEEENHTNIPDLSELPD